MLRWWLWNEQEIHQNSYPVSNPALVVQLPGIGMVALLGFRGSLIYAHDTMKVIKVLLYREGLMSYKQFIQELEDDISPVEAQSR
jgi:hypothetical protein